MLALAWVVAGVATAGLPTASAAPDRADVHDAEAQLRQIQARHQRAVEEYLQAQSRLDELDQEIAATEARLEELSARADQHAEDAAQVARDLYTGRSAASAAALLEASDVAEAGRRAAYLKFAERNHRAALEEYRTARVKLDRETEQLHAARTKAAELRDELEARAARIDAEAEQQQEEIAALRQQIAEREARQRRERERRARQRAEQRARERAEQEAAQASGPEPSAADVVAAGPGPSDAEAAEPADEPGDQAPDPGGQGTPSNAAQAAVDAAMSKRGSPYEWGAEGPDRFDCSGLSMWAWNQAGVNIPRTSRQQYAALPKVSRSELRPGDLVFFGDPIHHLGIYIGDGQMVEAPYTGETVRVNDINRSDYAGAARPGG